MGEANRLLADDARFDQHVEQVMRMAAASFDTFALATTAINNCLGEDKVAERAVLLSTFADDGDEALEYTLRLANIGAHFITAKMLGREVAG